ncbi:ATP-binding cassette domain-containing protein, partial [Corynebacterium frankenforstense]
VSFEHVAFGYSPEKLLMKDFNLNVKPGEMVAIVGPTGAGKTTLINLLERFYDISSGSIKYDGVDTRDLSREELRAHFSMVLQD